MDEQKSMHVELSSLKQASFLKPFAICMMTMLFQQLSAINVVVFFSSDIFESAGSSIPDSTATIIVGESCRLDNNTT